MKMRILTLAAESLLATVLATAANAGSSGLPGAPVIAGDPFILTFDEDGHANYSLNGGPLVNDPGFLLDGLLTYRLPEAVNPGDVTITDHNGTTISDGLRFMTDPNNPNGALMQYYSLDQRGQLADTGLPEGFNGGGFVGPSENADDKTFTWAPGGGNVYESVSNVPGPALGGGLTAIVALSLAGLFGKRRRA